METQTKQIEKVSAFPGRAIRWDLGRFAVERVCVCKSRSAECPKGWHMVDSHDDLGAAIADLNTLEDETRRGAYRVIDQVNGEKIA